MSAALRIVAVSASAYDVDRSECIAAGCDAFLAKPFREEELWAIMERVMGIVWTYGKADASRPAAPSRFEAPPGAETLAIYDLAAKGDLAGIRARAQALVRLDARYEPFAHHILDLAGRFKMKAIRQFLARFLQQENEPPPDAAA